MYRRGGQQVARQFVQTLESILKNNFVREFVLMMNRDRRRRRRSCCQYDQIGLLSKGLVGKFSYKNSPNVYTTILATVEKRDILSAMCCGYFLCDF